MSMNRNPQLARGVLAKEAPDLVNDLGDGHARRTIGGEWPQLFAKGADQVADAGVDLVIARWILCCKSQNAIRCP